MLQCGLNPAEWLVVDTGSHSLRLGFSGLPRPSLILPARGPPIDPQQGPPQEGPGHDETDAEESGAPKSKASAFRPLIHQGAVADWPNLLSLCTSALTSLLQAEPAAAAAAGGGAGIGAAGTAAAAAAAAAGDRKSFVITTQPLETEKGKERLLEYFFEEEKAASVALLPRAPLGLFASGRSRGLVVQMGHGLTSAVPVIEGYEVPHATFRMLIAGEQVTEAFKRLLSEKYSIPLSSLPQSLVETAKEKLCFLHPTGEGAPPQSEGGPSQTGGGPPAAMEEDFDSRALELPDGTIIELDESTRSLPGEIYFGRSLEGSVYSETSLPLSFHMQNPLSLSLPSLVYSSIQTMNEQYRNLLAPNTVFCGGGSLLRGLSKRMHAALQEYAAKTQAAATAAAAAAGGVGGGERERALPGSSWPAISLSFESQRAHATWAGGSMLASLSTFPSLAITKHMYDEGRTDKRALIERQVAAPI